MWQFLIPVAAFCLKGITGFGTALIVVPAFTFLEGPRQAIVIANVLDVVNGGVMVWLRRRGVALRQAMPFIGIMLIGTPLGFLLGQSLEPELLRKGIGVVVLLAAGSRFLPGVSSDKGTLVALSSGRRRLGLFSCFLAGVCGAAFGIPGPPLIIFGHFFLVKSDMRDFLVIVFVVESTVRFCVFVAAGLVAMETLIIGVKLIPFALAGLAAGMWLHVYVSERLFGWLTTVLLIVIGVRLLI